MIQILVLVLLISLNAFFAAAEMAFVSLNDAKIEKEAKSGNKKASCEVTVVRTLVQLYDAGEYEISSTQSLTLFFT